MTHIKGLRAGDVHNDLTPASVTQTVHRNAWQTDDWSNDAENSALITGINYILQYMKI